MLCLPGRGLEFGLSARADCFPPRASLSMGQPSPASPFSSPSPASCTGSANSRGRASLPYGTFATVRGLHRRFTPAQLRTWIVPPKMQNAGHKKDKMSISASCPANVSSPGLVVLIIQAVFYKIWRAESKVKGHVTSTCLALYLSKTTWLISWPNNSK